MENEEFKGEGTATVATPRFGHFYLLLALLLVVAGLALFEFFWFSGKVKELGSSLDDAGSQIKALTEKDQAQDGRLTATETADDGAARKLKAVGDDLDATKKALADLKTATQAADAELGKTVADHRKALDTRDGELSARIEAVKTEFFKEQEKSALVVNQIQDDMKFIISELGKKAEKAYMKFMERKLQKNIEEVSTRLDAVKGDLETQIGQTNTRIDQAVSDIGKTVEKKVDDRIKIDFVPSTSDGE